MKKLKAFIAILICAALLPALPALRSAAYDGSIYINNIEERASSLGITEEQLTELVGYLNDSLAACRIRLDVSSYGIDSNQANVIMIRDFISDNPKAFHVSNVRYAVSGGKIVSFIISYKTDINGYLEQLAECDAVAERLTEGITPDMPEALKVLLIHDRLITHCHYSEDYDYENGRYADDDYNAYGALVGGKAICQGYTLGLSYLLDYVGINSYTCASDILLHAWNIVIVDGEKYHVDATWDDPLFDIPGKVGHWNLLSSSDKLYASYPTPHNADDYDVSPVSVLYNNRSWYGSQSQFCLLNGELYYIDNTAAALCSYDYDYDASTYILDLSDYFWPAGPYSAWNGNYSRLACDGKYLYFSLPDGIYRYDPVRDRVETFFTPNMSGHDYFSVYGFTMEDGLLTCLAAATPNLRNETEKEYYTYRYAAPANAEPVVSGVEQGGVYDAPVTISWDVGEGTLDGSPFDNGGTVSDPGEHVLAVVNGGKAVTLTFTINAAQQIKGDVDGDGEITVADALSVLRVAARLAPSTPEMLAAGDIDGDGAITVADALSILRVAAKLATSL